MRLTLLVLPTLYFSSLLHAVEGSHYYRQHCAACHGQHGERKAWSVTKPIADWTPEAVKQALVGYKDNSRDRYGYGAYMHPQISKYSQEEIDAIAEYVSSLGNAQKQLISNSH